MPLEKSALPRFSARKKAEANPEVRSQNRGSAMGIRRIVKMQEPVICPTWQRRATDAKLPELLTILTVLP
ncbi:MAG: hypothetical protein LC796_03385 [Acidobacteria bacterium]|nr:hypothetical protein [Acidobacteriota bacterium]MCA1611859.1 hypothetical protein [Acidobacteriota bacterium]